MSTLQRSYLSSTSPFLAVGLENRSKSARPVSLETLLDRAADGLPGVLLDAFDLAVLVVSENLQLQQLNRQAEELLGRRDGLLCAQGKLLGSHASGTALLSKMTRSLIRGSKLLGGVRTAPCLAARLERPSLRQPLEIAAKVLGPATDVPSNRILLFVSDPERETACNIGLLKYLYGLTEAEARLAGLLMDGHTLESAARKLGVTKDTVRKHVQSTFQKTGTNRQSGLLRLLFRSVARLP